MIRKPVYLGDVPIGTAASWPEAADLLEARWGRGLDSVTLMKHGSEGPDGFYISASALGARLHEDEREAL